MEQKGLPFKDGFILTINTKKMKQIIKNSIIVLLLMITNTLFAQQDPSYSMYHYNMNVVNPAYAGVNGYTEISVNFRSQWIKIAGSPNTESISLGIPINDKLGVGFSFVNDEVFVLKETDTYIDFSYKLQVSENTNLYFGLKAGGSFINIDLNELGIVNDPLFSENVSQFNPNFGVGFYLKGEKYYVNLSAPSLLKSERYDKEGALVSNATDELHLYTGAGYTFNLSDNVDLMPSMMSRYVVGAPISLDLTATVDLYDIVELGVSYRLDESVSGIACFKLGEVMRFGYAYEITTSEVGNYSDGTHEVVMQFRF